MACEDDIYCTSSTQRGKLLISIMATLLFILVSLPPTLAFTKTLLDFGDNQFYLHAFVFFIVTFLMMKPWKRDAACLCFSDQTCEDVCKMIPKK